MSSDTADKRIIGRAEVIGFPEFDIAELHARIDTGARTSALWASNVREKDDELSFTLFSPKSPYYTGQTHIAHSFGRQVVTSSNGQAEERYVIQVLVRLKGKSIRAKFTLADRSTQVYPVLIGRNVLRGKFIVDVKHGQVLNAKEKQRISELNAKNTRKQS